MLSHNLKLFRAFSSKRPSSATYKLVFVRHGESEWNMTNRFTGWYDVGLTQKGIDEASNAGKVLKQEDFRCDPMSHAHVV